MKNELTWLKTIIIGGIIGFITNFTWYFNNEWLTLIICFVLFGSTGFLIQTKFNSVVVIKKIGLFWYISGLMIFATIVNYSDHLLILLTTAICAFVLGQLAARADRKIIS